MPEDYRPISTAPRDGTLIEVMDDDSGSFYMRWNPAGINELVSLQQGIWESYDASFTWSEDMGFGPTHWRPMPPDARPPTRVAEEKTT